MPLRRGLALILPLAALYLAAGGCEPRNIMPPPDTLPPPPPVDTIEVMVGAGDIAHCSWTEDEATANLIDTIAGTVFTLGDNAYPHGRAEDFANCYEPNWGRFKDRTRPVLGNHEYETAFAAGHFDYYGESAAGDRTKGYYSYDLGSWHVVVLNSNITASATSAQVAWLRADLAASTKRCTIAMWHHPRFSSGQHGSWAAMQPFWDVLYQYGAEIVLTGHDHLYERFGPQTPSGSADPTYGIRQFVVGTGGRSNYQFTTAEPNSEVRRTGTPGVLKLTLRNSTYSWQFIPVAGHTFTDAGDGTCHDPNPNPPPPPPPTGAVVLAVAGNIGDCGGSEDNATGQILDTLPGYVLTLGDNAFPDGTLADYNNCYEPAWGRHKSRTFAVLGNHEYNSGTADGSFDYFGNRAGPRGKGYYSQNIGPWHLIVLNDNGAYVPFAAGSAQDQWLASDLASWQGMCTVVAWHQPAFLSSNTPGFTTRDRRAIWDRLYSAGVDLILNGHQHHYERFSPLRPDGSRDDAQGIRQFNVGTGGESVVLPTVAIHPNSEVRSSQYGVLKLTLEQQSYRWTFIPTSGAPVDSGSATCH
jgi:hypothetical protein